MNDIKGLYVITDRQLLPGRGHVEIARCAVRGGAAIVQLRDKTASDRDFYNWAVEIRDITQAAGVLFIVNDRVDVAAAVEADGINIGQNDLPVKAARKVLPKGAIVGVSCSNMDQVRQAEEAGADYLGFGPIFPTTTKPDAAANTGLDMLKSVIQTSHVPVAAIGGINAANAADVVKAGARCICVVSAVVCAQDMVEAASELAWLFDLGRLVDIEKADEQGLPEG